MSKHPPRPFNGDFGWLEAEQRSLTGGPFQVFGGRQEVHSFSWMFLRGGDSCGVGAVGAYGVGEVCSKMQCHSEHRELRQRHRTQDKNRSTPVDPSGSISCHYIRYKEPGFRSVNDFSFLDSLVASYIY